MAKTEGRELGTSLSASTFIANTKSRFITGLYERFSLSRTLVGIPPIITYITSLREAPSLERLNAAIDHLISSYPLLQCAVPYPHTRHPRYVPRGVLHASDVLVQVRSDSGSAKVLEQELDSGKQFNLHDGPLWRVVLYGGSVPRLALTLNHLLCDGSGGKNLVGHLLTLLSTENLPEITPPSTLPPSMESTVPEFLESPTEAGDNGPPPEPDPPLWPNPPPCAPYTRDGRVAVIHISAPEVSKLKDIGKAHSVKTLQPLLHAIAVASLSYAVKGLPIHVLTSTPISTRDPVLGHPYATGNYVGGHSQLYQPLKSSLLFWNTAREYGVGLTNPETISADRRVMSFLKYLPDPDPMPLENKTGWELLFEKAMNKPTPYRGSIELSNVGVLKEELSNVSDVAFAQAPNPVNVGLCLNVSRALTSRLHVMQTKSYSLSQLETVLSILLRYGGTPQ
jgi:hypothetical protein